MRVLLGLVLALVACRLDDHDVVLRADASTHGKVDAFVPPACAERQTPGAAYFHQASGTPYPGASCITAGCHRKNLEGPGAVAFAFAGTLVHPDARANAGVLMVAQPTRNGPATGSVSDEAGSFYIPWFESAYPATVGISVCPTTKQMIDTADEDMGDCNGCHGQALPLLTID